MSNFKPSHGADVSRNKKVCNDHYKQYVPVTQNVNYFNAFYYTITYTVSPAHFIRIMTSLLGKIMLLAYSIKASLKNLFVYKIHNFMITEKLNRFSCYFTRRF